MPRHSFSTLFCLEFSRLWLAGRSPIAPGTCGSAVAIGLAPFLFLPLPFIWRVVALVALFFIGSYTATRAAQTLGVTDPGEIVIDELLGQWLALLPFAVLSLRELLVLFMLFRFFDIVKPWPVKASEQWLPTGYGIMLDDVFAGLWAMLIFAVGRFIYLLL